MSAKFVWGVVLIVLGVVAVINGFQQIGEISQYDELIEVSKRQLGQYQSLIKDDLRLYERESHNAKVGGAFKIIAGIGLALVGTWLIQDSQPQRRRKEKLPPLPKSPHVWKIMTEEEDEEFTRPTESAKLSVVPIYSDPKRPEISKARCKRCEKEFTYPTKRAGDIVPCPKCRVEFELP
jgi:hypothetical protein